MANIMIDDKHFDDIADAIRELNYSTETYKPREMASAIRGLSSKLNKPIYDIYTYHSGSIVYDDEDEMMAGNYSHTTLNELRYIIDTSEYSTDVVLTFTYNNTDGMNYYRDKNYEKYDRVEFIYWVKDPVITKLYNDSLKLHAGCPYENIEGGDEARNYLDHYNGSDVTAKKLSFVIPADADSIALCFVMIDMPKYSETGCNDYPAFGSFKVYDMTIEGV